MSISGKIYIAVIDDDEILCRSFSRLLRAAGMFPVSYGSAEQFLADDKHPRFDCLILDIQLGGLSGIELQRQLRESRDMTPVIFVTAQDAPEVREEAMAAGGAAFFKKTDPGAEVLNTIRRLAEGN